MIIQDVVIPSPFAIAIRGDLNCLDLFDDTERERWRTVSESRFRKMGQQRAAPNRIKRGVEVVAEVAPAIEAFDIERVAAVVNCVLVDVAGNDVAAGKESGVVPEYATVTARKVNTLSKRFGPVNAIAWRSRRSRCARFSDTGLNHDASNISSRSHVVVWMGALSYINSRARMASNLCLILPPLDASSVILSRRCTILFRLYQVRQASRASSAVSGNPNAKSSFADSSRILREP